jgi:tetratricopeptide (TPR) repeat protein
MSKSLKSLPKLSLCTIVKNERQNLPRCLDSVKPFVDEIIVVDTGSQDGTPELALQYGADVKYFEWCADFAAARNYSISQATGDWILVLDADEALVVNSEEFKEQLISQPEVLAYSLIRTEADDQGGMTPLYTLRLFRNSPELRYVNRFHEQLKYENQQIPQHLVGHLESLAIVHYGYTEQQVLQKNINRNIPILEAIRQEEGLSLMLLYCLAGMYSATQEPEKADACYVEAFDRLLPNLIAGNSPEIFGFVPSLLFSLAARSLQQKDYETTRLLCQRGLEWCPDYPPLNYISGFTLIELGFPLGAIAYFERCIQLGQEGSYYKGEPFELSFITTDPACGLGAAYRAMNRLQEAAVSFELALSFDPNCQVAQQNLDRIKHLLAAHHSL